jgi:hypothetical protein
MSDNSGLGGEIKNELTNATTCIEKVIDNIPSISADTFNSAYGMTNLTNLTNGSKVEIGASPSNYDSNDVSFPAVLFIPLITITIPLICSIS